MNWLQLIEYILTLTAEELPVVQRVITGLRDATAAHQETANLAVATALKK